MKTLEAKIYPNKAQLAALNSLLEGCRRAYNDALAMKIDVYKLGGVILGQYELEKIFRGYGSIPTAMKGQLLRRLDASFRRFFKHGGFPRFKAENRFRSIPLKEYGNDYRIVNGKLRAYPTFGIGSLKIKGLQEFEKAKSGRLVRRATGWYLQICVETIIGKPIKKVKKAVGLDVGLKSFVVDSEGKHIKPPKFFIQSQNKLAVSQRLIAKKVKGSNRRKKQSRLVAKLHEHIRNQRKNFSHKASRKYADKYDLVSVEKLNIKGMVRNRGLSKAISDASWGQFTNYLSYKLKTLGKVFVEVNPHMTTQNCSACGETVRKSLSVRTHACPNCGFVADRDHNAALNILNLGLERAIGEGIVIATPLTRRMDKTIVQCIDILNP
jgi:putative transposase